MKDIKLFKEVVIGKYNFRLSVNRAIFIEVNKKFPEFFKRALEVTNNDFSPANALVNGEADKLFEYLDYSMEQSKIITEYALPILLKEANETINPLEVIDYAKENDVLEQLSNGVVEFILSVFTQRELTKPKVKFSMK